MAAHHQAGQHLQQKVGNRSLKRKVAAKWLKYLLTMNVWRTVMVSGVCCLRCLVSGVSDVRSVVSSGGDALGRTEA